MKLLHTSIKRKLTTKFLVGTSLVIALLGMSVILVIGYMEIRKSANGHSASSEGASSLTENISTMSEQKSTVQTVGGEGGTPTITLTTTPERVAPNGSATLSWEASNADVCAASGAWSGVKNAVGTQDTGVLTETKDFSLTCTNANGPTTVKTTVIIDTSITQATTSETPSTTGPAPETAPGGSAGETTTTGNTGSSGGASSGGTTTVAPVLTMSISSATITTGGSATISWSVNSTATPTPACTASGSWSGAKSTSGSQNTSPAAGSYTYTLVCTNSAGSSTKSVSLTVNAPASSCGSGGSCTSAEVSSHNSTSNCWTIINGNVYAISSTFLSSTHSGSLGGTNISGSKKPCGANKSSIFNSKHSNGSLVGGGQTANWWLTGNGNSLVGAWSGN